MEPADAPVHKKLHLQLPYKPAAWLEVLQQAGLVEHFSTIPDGLHFGFTVGYPPISHVQNPPNSTSISFYSHKFDEIVHKEITKGRYIGPPLLLT